MNRPFRTTDLESMPPPAKRIKSLADQQLTLMNNTAAAPVSPEKDATVASIMRKRLHASSSHPTNTSPTKRIKQEKMADSPTTTTQEPKVDAHVFASAFALASLALSPQQAAYRGAPYSPDGSFQTREDDGGRVDGDYSSCREPSSPYRVGSMDGTMPISPQVVDQHRRRVKFARRVTGMRSIPARFDRMGVATSRMSGFRHGAHYHHASYAPNRQAYPFDFAPSQQQQQQQSPWLPPMNNLHPSHPPPRPPREQDWICDYCHVASFVTYDEACAHESTCRPRCNGPTGRNMLVPTTSRRDDSHSMPLYDQHRMESRNKEIPEDPTQYFDGTVALAVPSADSEWLSELNCFVRQHCVEAFSATEEDIARASKRGKIILGQVGIRCKFCIHRDTKDKAVAAVSYPTTVSGIYESVKRWQRVHQAVCQDVPQDVREKLESLQNTTAWVPTTRQYWADSARSLGMTDSHNGIRFERPPSAPEKWVPSNHAESSATAVGEDGDDAGEEAGFIALPCDKDEIPDYVYFLMRQVESCRFTEADRFVARSKGPVGFAGFQCRHCNGHAGLGKYFPLTAKSLATNSTSQNIHAHILKCRKCPPEIKETLVRLKTEKGKSPRLVPGWRREFFDRIWERMHGEKPQHC